MKFIGFIILCSVAFNLHGQVEEVGPIMAKPFMASGPVAAMPKVNEGTFDSTFIYLPDTLDLPIFDEFSSNKFQSYSATYTDPGVTFDKDYRLLDLTSIPLANDLIYTQQQTFRRTYDVGNGTFTDANFAPLSVQLGDLTSYPTSYNTIDVFPPYYIYDTIDYPNDSDTIWIPDAEIFQDSATQFFAVLNSPELYWLEKEAFHNYTMAKDPWTIGVVTFDGLDEKGYPYAFGTTTSGIADHLTSKPIDMSSLNAGDSVYLSFLFQPQGLCDKPEAGDSLILEFYEAGIDEWNEIWRGGGTGVVDFERVHVLIDSSIYFSNAFQFRYKNIGGLSGSLDHYHLDYVHLRALSGYQDTIFKDFAFVYPINTLLEDYTSVPWDHYKNNFAGKMSDSVTVVIRNGSNIDENNSLAGSVEVSYSAAPEGSFAMSGSNLSNGALNYGPFTTYLSYHDFSAGYHYDESKIGDAQTFDILGIAAAQYPNFTANDSTISQQVFENYYAYDDGTAELAYGPTGIQSRLAIKYEAYEADSILGMMIHFVPSVNDVSNKLFLLTIWDDNGGVPGSVLYEDDVFFPRQPKYQYDRNVFTYYFLADTMKVAVDQTFYVGWRQFDADRLNVGLDMNIDNSHNTFYSVDGGNSWDVSSFDGSVMIRPIFSTSLDNTLGIETKEIERDVFIYPNPTNGMVNIQTEGFNFQGVEVYNLQGSLMFKSIESTVDLSSYSSGFYLFKIEGSNKLHKVYKN